LCIAALFLLASGCYVAVVSHSQERALSDSNDFVSAFLVDRDAEHAWRLGDPELQRRTDVHSIQGVLETIDARVGRLREILPDSYIQTPGRTMEVLYVGTYERGLLYHRIVLAGDKSGYRVTGFWFQAEPYPQESSRQPFRNAKAIRTAAELPHAP